MPETDFEKERRRLREFEGKNIANYKVILTEWIRATMNNVRIMVVLSATGIGLVVMVLLCGRIHAWWRPVIAIGSFMGFFVSLLLSMGILERNISYLSHSLNSGCDRSLDLENFSRSGKKFFVFGCLCLVGLSLLSAEGPRCSGRHLKAQVAEKKGPLQLPIESSINIPDDGGQGVRVPTESVSLGEVEPLSVDKKSSSPDPVRNVIKTNITASHAQNSSKVSGNRGIFKSGTTR